MSTSELLVILFVGLVVMKPSDIVNIYKHIKKTINYFTEFRQEILEQLDISLDKEKDILSKEAEQLNLYLKTIVDKEGSYEGDYSLQALEKKYRSLNTENSSIQKIKN